MFYENLYLTTLPFNILINLCMTFFTMLKFLCK